MLSRKLAPEVTGSWGNVLYITDIDNDIDSDI